jgi:tetratricopeptide (TPR) repeat protein
MRRALAGGAALWALLGLMAVPAQAEETAVRGTQALEAAGRTLSDAGRRAHRAGRYAAAADAYRAAYELYPVPVLLFDLGQVTRLLGDEIEALRLYRRYLVLMPAAANRPLVETLIAEIETRMGTDGGELPLAVEPSAALLLAPPAESVPVEAPAVAAAGSPVPDATLAHPAGSRRSRTLLIVASGAAVVALGVIVVGLAVAFSGSNPGP